jgi:hypothetical protein
VNIPAAGRAMARRNRSRRLKAVIAVAYNTPGFPGNWPQYWSAAAITSAERPMFSA